MKVEEIVKAKENLDKEVCRLGKELEKCFDATFYQIDVELLESRTAAFVEARKKRDEFLAKDFT